MISILEITWSSRYDSRLSYWYDRLGMSNLLCGKTAHGYIVTKRMFQPGRCVGSGLQCRNRLFDPLQN